ncbi:hypothetical protein APY94_03905 [Thermococcus celericrescens]|uniref:Uncharacterized protein n=1 Tax=Thermococcus celericrescens TaxID=227598 RepID=A0A100XYD4_9EURY|nr:hypothetical protein [Thermococcus celericrescens]KUH33884.1 hypothetical protein APY94_03905 [Thermococcus celericrescens]
MIIGRFLSPSYHIRVLKLDKFKPEEIVNGFRRRGAHVSEFPRDIDIELAIESFMASSYGDYVYVLKFPKGRLFLARHTKRLHEKKWPNSGRYIARDENGLKRFLLREVSRKSMVIIEVPRIIIWGAVWWLVWNYFERYPLGTFLLFFVGFFLDDLSKVLEYFVLGHCRD